MQLRPKADELDSRPAPKPVLDNINGLIWVFVADDISQRDVIFLLFACSDVKDGASFSDSLHVASVR